MCIQYIHAATFDSIKAMLHDLSKNFNLPNCNRKCFKGYKQIFILLKIHAEMVDNDTFF